MQHFKKIGSKIIWPGIAVMVLLIVASVVLLCYTFLFGENDAIISYLEYMISTYTLIVVVCRIITIVKEAKRAVYANPHTNRFLTDVPYRIRISLYGSFIINLAYAFVKFMNSATGCIICLLILGTAFYMIVNASRRLRMLD